MKIEYLKNEYWWGGDVHLGYKMPFGNGIVGEVDFEKDDSPNSRVPMIISNKGRYIWCEKAFTVTFKESYFEVNNEVTLEDGYENLRGAYLAAMKKHFSFSGKIPDEIFFTKSQFNTWIELLYDQNEKAILDYARQIVKNNFQPGILIIDDGWMSDYGTWTFSKDKFNNPKSMVNKLHDMGFKVMLWICPFVSPDSHIFRELQNNDYLLKDKNNETAIRKWWNGYSGIIDITNSNAILWFENQLKNLQSEYGIDGFKFDAGDPDEFRDDDCAYCASDKLAITEAYCRFALKFSMNELRAGWKCGGEALVMRLADKKHSWTDNGINMLIPNSMLQGICGYSYVCPDMIGGGEYLNFIENSKSLDQELIVRYAQASALLPMMQFSAAPWRILDSEHFALVLKAARLHEQYGELFVELAKYASKTGEPIIRYMEYVFPNQGFERVVDQFMLGNDILVAPNIEKNSTRRIVKFPKGNWIDANGIIYHGEQIVESPLCTLLYFNREDS